MSQENENQNTPTPSLEMAHGSRDVSPALSSGLGQWLTNSDDHRKRSRKEYVGFRDPGGHAAHVKWLKDKLIGRPKATETYTAEQLEAMGMIGIYAQPEETK